MNAHQGPPQNLRRSRSICVTKFVRKKQFRRTSLCADFADRNRLNQQSVPERDENQTPILQQVS